MWSNHRIRSTALLAIAVFVAGCGDNGTEPEMVQEFDAEGALADFEALEAVLGSAELAGFQSLGDRTPFGSSPASIDAVAGMHGGDMGDGGRAFVLGLARRMSDARSNSLERPAMGPIISGWHRGTTFVYDPTTDDYQPDLTRSDAPDTGVRFIMYELDTSGTPILEEEVGYADLIDEGDGSAEDIVLRLRVVHMEETVLDYRTTLDHDATSGALTVNGFLRGDDVRLDFDLAIAAEQVNGEEQVDLDFEFRVDSRGFVVSGTVSGIEDDDDGNGDVDISVEHGMDSLRVDVTGTDGILNGTFYVNGQVFATITGPEDEPTIVDANGEPLTWAEVLVLRHILDVVEDVFDFVEDLIDPVDDLVILGIIL